MIYTLNLDLNQGIWIAKNMGYNQDKLLHENKGEKEVLVLPR